MSKEENNAPIEKLFGSKTRAKLLRLFFSDMNKSYYVREITRLIEEQINSVRRELINLEGVGIVKSETYDNKVYYSANSKSPYAHAFQELFSPRKPSAVAGPAGPRLANAVEVRRVVRASNSFPGQEGIDMLIVGDDRTKKLTRWAEVIEKRQGRPMNYVIMSQDDYLYRKSVRDKFLLEVMETEMTELYDPEKMVKAE